LIQEVTAGGAVALDAEGNKWPVTEDFVLAHWDGEISWLYPYERGHERLTKWMSGFGVLKVQQILQQMGYSVEPRGLYDSTTFNEVMRFQRDFGLEADGIVDARTRALLYQMSG
jgi:N-acetyl-anhydromuramyl-L-alanine amidase AmpD